MIIEHSVFRVIRPIRFVIFRSITQFLWSDERAGGGVSDLRHKDLLHFTHHVMRKSIASNAIPKELVLIFIYTRQ